MCVGTAITAIPRNGLPEHFGKIAFPRPTLFKVIFLMLGYMYVNTYIYIYTHIYIRTHIHLFLKVWHKSSYPNVLVHPGINHINQHRPVFSVGRLPVLQGTGNIPGCHLAIPRATHKTGPLSRVIAEWGLFNGLFRGCIIKKTLNEAP